MKNTIKIIIMLVMTLLFIKIYVPLMQDSKQESGLAYGCRNLSLKENIPADSSGSK